MAGTLIVKPLGLVLQKAGLVSPEQVQIALEDRVTSPNRKIGEIMAFKGWIEQQTADFFADQWPVLIAQKLDRPLGQYLKAAGLLNESQIDAILTEQKTTGLKFGAVAVVKGLVAQKTIDFFLEQLELIALKARSKNYLSLSKSKRSPKIIEVENYLLHNNKCQPLELIKLYQQVWQQQAILATNSIAEAELLHSGLVVKQNNQIKLGRQRHIFDHNWIEQQLAKLEPYSKIRLKLFGLETKASLPYKVLTEVRLWTNNQPFLTQKIYQIIQQKESFISRGKEAEKIAILVEKYIIDNWSTGAAGEHLNQLSSALLQNRQHSPVLLLQTYQKIWQQSAIPQDNSQEQAYLLNLGLIVPAKGQVSVANRIYRQVFNYSWIEEQLKTWKNSLLPLSSQEIRATDKSSIPRPKNVNRYKIAAIIPLTLLLGSMLWLGFSLISKYSQISQFKQANQLWQAKKYQQAAIAYDRLLQDEAGNHPSIWINRGYALAGLEEYDAMLHSCSAATAIDPNSSLAWNCQGEALYHQGQYELAVKAFAKALEINPHEPIFWINQSESLFLLKQYQAAYAASKRSTELIKNNSSQNNHQLNQSNLSIAYNRIGEILLIQKKYRQALAAFEQSLVHSADYLSAQQGKGIALYELGNSQQAAEIFDTILQRQDLSESQKAMTWLYQGINFCDARQFTAAEKAFARAISLKTDPESQAIAKAGCNTSRLSQLD